jgi:hypothetical protein
MSNGNVDTSSARPGGYERSRLNAVRHGILSQNLVLPWEEQSEYDELLESLIAEHSPARPTEHHLVEELAGIIWRTQRLALAEASAFRAGLHRALGKDPWGGNPVLIRALVHLDGGKPTENAAAAVRATPEDTKAELQDLVEGEAATERALAILGKGRAANAYDEALAVLHEDTLAGWSEMLAEVGADDLDAEDPDGGDYEDDSGTGARERYQPDAPGLQQFLEDEVVPWYRRRRRELENRNLIRAQAFGEALEPDQLDKLARYEVHLDRKLERVLGMLLRLQDLRRTITPNGA